MRVKGHGRQDYSVVKELTAPTHEAAVQALVEWLVKQVDSEQITAVGHRIVHGGPDYSKSCVINSSVLAALRRLEPLDPEHLPMQLQLVETLHVALPRAVQIACFDTAFHHGLPVEARLVPVPRRYETDGLRRYGFHGLSYSYLITELARLTGNKTANGRVVLAHLGNGASLAAVKNGQSIDTTMGLTPAGGIPMSTRSGDLDPGVIYYLLKRKNLNAEQFNQIITEQSGLLGLSGSSADMKLLLEKEAYDQRAADAVNVFCYQARKTIGAYAAAMGGLDAVVFSGGMGENAPKIRARVCQGLDFLGIDIEAGRNNLNAEVISTNSSRVPVWVIHADEAITMARDVAKIMNPAEGVS